jgi:hypothetical protein
MARANCSRICAGLEFTREGTCLPSQQLGLGSTHTLPGLQIGQRVRISIKVAVTRDAAN